MTTTLGAYRICEIWEDCLAEVGQDTTEAAGITHNVLFSTAKINSYRPEIAALLAELPDEFQAAGGGGWSFLNACMDRHGVLWTGEHRTMERLFHLGMASGYAAYLLPREYWSAFPGGMPYVVVTAPAGVAAVEEES